MQKQNTSHYVLTNDDACDRIRADRHREGDRRAHLDIFLCVRDRGNEPGAVVIPGDIGYVVPVPSMHEHDLPRVVILRQRDISFRHRAIPFPQQKHLQTHARSREVQSLSRSRCVHTHECIRYRRAGRASHPSGGSSARIRQSFLNVHELNFAISTARGKDMLGVDGP